MGEQRPLTIEIALTAFIAIGLCCAGAILTGPSWAHLVPDLPVRIARAPTPSPTLTPFPLPTFTVAPTLPPLPQEEIPLKDAPGVREYILEMMDQQGIIHASIDRILNLFEGAAASEQINTYDILDEAERIKGAYEELRLLQPPPSLSQTHNGILTASEKCSRSMDYLAEWVEMARAGADTGERDLQNSADLLLDCRAGLNETTTELVRQLEGDLAIEPASTPWPTVPSVPRVPIPTPTPSPTITLTPTRTPTPWSISTVPAWPVTNPTYTPWAPPPTRESGDDSAPGSCCRVCREGKACGNSCIARDLQCHEPPGCACNG